MPVITMDRFELGIDLRKGDSVADANRLRDLKNAYVNSGWAIQKRPGMRPDKSLTSGTHGLLSFNNQLHTFSILGIEHADPMLVNNVVLNPNNINQDIDRILYADVFNGRIYVVVRYLPTTDENGEEIPGDIVHHYLDDYPEWQPNTSYQQNNLDNDPPIFADIVKPATGGIPGAYYRCVKDGNSGGSEPTWLEISSRPPVWEPNYTYEPNTQVSPSGREGYWETSAGGVSGATEPTWNESGDTTDGTVTWTYVGPTTVITDGTTEWEPVTTAISDPNCPHSSSALVLGSKIYAIDEDIVRFSGTDNPLDWSSENDAGFLPTGTRAPGSPTALALGDFQGDLVVFMDDSIQVWAIDPDPQRDKLRQIIGNVGTHYPLSVHKVGDDLYFLSDVGFRSIAQQKYTTNLEDVDVGTAIDPMVRPIIAELPDLHILSVYYSGGGQYICAIGQRLFVYSFSRTSKVSAWSYYDVPWEVEAMDILGAKLYVRAGDIIYHADSDYHTDDGEIFEVSGLMAYQSFKKPGVMKHVYGCDVVFEGQAEIRHRYDARFPDESTGWVRMYGDTRPGPLMPVEVMSTEVAFEFDNQTDEDFRLDSVAYHYYELESI